MSLSARSLQALLAFSLLTAAPAAARAAAQAQGLDDYAKAIEAHPEDAKAYEAYAIAAISARQYDDAVAKLKLGIARIANFNRGYYLLAYAYRSKGAWADAAAFYRVAISVKQQEIEAYFGLGKSLAGLGDNQDAIAAFKAYVEREQDPAKAKFVEQAKAEIAKLEAPPTPHAVPGADAARLKAEADTLRNQGKLEEAVATYKKALAADPNNQDLHNDLGNAYFALKRYADAADSFKQAVTRDASFAIAWYNLANALRKAERRSEAVSAYKKYIALQPTDPDPYFGLGQTLKAMGDTASAIEAFRQYLAMEKRPEQQKWIDKAKAELGALEAASRSAAPAKRGKVGFEN